MVDSLPQHVAIIPDGNRRWSAMKGLSRLEGHKAGAEAMHNVVDCLNSQGIKYLTVWGFSSDNWKRSDSEVNDLFHLLTTWIENDTPWLNSHGVRLRHIGRLWELPDFLQLAINRAIALTKDNTEMTLNLAFNYTGRGEILDAVCRLVEDNIPPQSIDRELFSHYLYDSLPDVDLVIRTAGEVRLSNFLIWQTAYSEFYFTSVLWPDFSIKELEEALSDYNNRQRRFGGD